MTRVIGVPAADLSRWLHELPNAASRLVLEAELAKSGMGLVEVVVDPALGRRIARKTLIERDDESLLKLFVREARIVAQLDHAYIAPIHDLGVSEDGAAFFTMKLVDGQTLYDLVSAAAPGALDRETLVAALEAVRKVCDALSFAHARGVLHCDLKPENVMVGDHGQVHLMDWGVARLVEAGDEADDEPVIMGTPAYMAPEQAYGERQGLDVR